MADEGELSDAELEDGEVLSSDGEEEGLNLSKESDGPKPSPDLLSSSAQKDKKEDSTDCHDNHHSDHGSARGHRPGESSSDLNSSSEGRRRKSKTVTRGDSSSGEIYSDDEEAAYFPNKVKSRRHSQDRSPSHGTPGDSAARQRTDRSQSPAVSSSRHHRHRSVSSEREEWRGARRGDRKRSRSPKWSRHRSSDEDERDSKTGEDYRRGRNQHRSANRDRNNFGSTKNRYGSPVAGGQPRFGGDARKDGGRGGGNDSDSDSYHYGGNAGGKGNNSNVRGRRFGGYGQTRNYQQRGGGAGKWFGRGSGGKAGGNYGGYSSRGFHNMGGNVEMRGSILSADEISSKRQKGVALLPKPKERQCDNLDQFNYPAPPSWYLEEVEQWEKREEERKVAEAKSGEVVNGEKTEDNGKVGENGERKEDSMKVKGNGTEMTGHRSWWIEKEGVFEGKDENSKEPARPELNEECSDSAGMPVPVSVLSPPQGVLPATVTSSIPLTTSLGDGVSGTGSLGLASAVSLSTSSSLVPEAVSSASLTPQPPNVTTISPNTPASLASLATLAAVTSAPTVTSAFVVTSVSTTTNVPLAPSIPKMAVAPQTSTSPAGEMSSELQDGSVSLLDGSAPPPHAPPDSSSVVADSSAGLDPLSRTPSCLSLSPRRAVESTSAATASAFSQPVADSSGSHIRRDTPMEMEATPTSVGDCGTSSYEVEAVSDEDNEADSSSGLILDRRDGLLPESSGDGLPIGEATSGGVGGDNGKSGEDGVASDVSMPSKPLDEGNVSMETSDCSVRMDTSNTSVPMETSNTSVPMDTSNTSVPDESNVSGKAYIVNDSGGLSLPDEDGVASETGTVSGDDRLKVNPQKQQILFSDISRIQVHVAPVSDPATPSQTLPPNEDSLRAASTHQSLQPMLETTPISPCTSDDGAPRSPSDVLSMTVPVQTDRDLGKGDEGTVTSTSSQVPVLAAKQGEQIPKDTNNDEDDDLFTYTLRPRKQERKRKKTAKKPPPAFRPKLLSESDEDINYDDYLDQLVDEEEDLEEPLGIVPGTQLPGGPSGVSRKENAKTGLTSSRASGRQESSVVVSPNIEGRKGGLDAGFMADDDEMARDVNSGRRPRRFTRGAKKEAQKLVQTAPASGAVEEKVQEDREEVPPGGVHAWQPPPVQQPPRYKKGVCKYFLNNFCVHGDMCEYSHSGTPTKKREVCKFYLAGNCNKGASCNYYHGDFPCKFFHIKSYCKNGDHCKFSHAPLTAETRGFLSVPAEGDKPENTATPVARDVTDDSSLIVSISLSKLEERQRLKAFSIPKLKITSSSSSPTPPTSFSSPSLPSDARDVGTNLPPGAPPPPPPPFLQGRPPPPGQVPFPLAVQSPSRGSNIGTQPVPLFPPKPPGIMAACPPVLAPRLPQQPQFGPPPPGNLAGPLPPGLPPPQGIPGGLPLQLPPPPVPAMQPPPAGEKLERKVLLPTPPISMRVSPEDLKSMKPVEYWEDPTVREDSDGSAPPSNQGQAAPPPVVSLAPPPPSGSQGMLSLPHGDSLVQPGSTKPQNMGGPLQQFQGGPALLKTLSQHESTNATPPAREGSQGVFRLDPRQSRLAASEGDPRLGSQWHSRQPPDRASVSVQNVPYSSNIPNEPGVMTTPYPMDPKRTPPYQTESASDAKLYIAESSHSAAPSAMARQSSPLMMGVASGMKQEAAQRHFPADKPPVSWGVASRGSEQQQFLSGASTAFQPASRPVGDVARREGDGTSRRMDPRLKYSHLKIKSKKPGAESETQRPPLMPPSASSSSKKAQDDISRDNSPFEVPKLLQDPSALNKLIDPRELFKNPGGSSGSLDYETETSGPFGLFKSNLFSSRSQQAQESPDDKGSQQQFGEITLRESIPPNGDPREASIGNKDNGPATSSGQSQTAVGGNGATECSDSAGPTQIPSVPSYLAQLDMGLGKDLKIESALGALASKNTDDESKMEDKEDLQARKLPNIFVGL